MLVGKQVAQEKYSSGRRGPPAKGVGRIKPARGFKSLFLRSGLALKKNWKIVVDKVLTVWYIKQAVSQSTANKNLENRRSDSTDNPEISVKSSARKGAGRK